MLWLFIIGSVLTGYGLLKPCGHLIVPWSLATLTDIVTVVVNVCPYEIVSSESCFYQRCLACRPENAAWPGSRIECDPSNWVSAEWVHNLGHPPPGTASRVPIEYRCLKMVAAPDDKSFGNTVDVLRGCVPRAQVDSVCLSLVAVERARGHSDARCYVCRGNDCNSAWTTRANAANYTFSLLLCLYYVLR